ncbi:MAG: phage GP46 family protein [Pseudomonadota bacterium]
MRDIAIGFNGQLLLGDLVYKGNDLGVDETLLTAIYVSLFTDRRAGDEDETPDGDRRGWWGDSWPDHKGDEIGSRRWLYLRRKQTPETAQLIQEADTQALAWLIEDGHATAVAVHCEWQERGLLAERVEITLPIGSTRVFSFDQKVGA